MQGGAQDVGKATWLLIIIPERHFVAAVDSL